MNTFGKVLLIILAIWIGLGVLSFLIKGLFWLAILGGIAFVAYAIFGKKGSVRS